KLADLASLSGLGLAAGISLGASAVTSSLATRILRAIGLEQSTAAQVILWVLGTAIGIAASTVMFAYLLAGIPRLHVPHGVLARASFVAAALFEATKVVIASYLNHVAGRSVYG